MKRRDNPSAKPTMSNCKAIDSVAIRRNKDKLYRICSNLNKRVAGLGTEDNPRSVNLLTQVNLGVNGVSLYEVAPLVGITSK